MVANFSNPTNSSNYANVLDDLKNRDLSIAKLDYTGDSNIPTGVKRLSSSGVIEQYNGSTWDFFGTLVPTGVVLPDAGATPPTGFLACDGSAVSRTTYATLFARIGTTYGVGDNSTTFNVPDLRQRFPLGKAASGTGSTLGGTGGAIDHVHSIPAHYHGMGTGATLNITSSGTHTTSISHDHGAFTSGGGSAHSHGVTDPGHTHAIWRNTDVPGGGSNRRGVADTNINASANMNSSTTGISINSESGHTHSIDVPNFSGNSSSDGAHTHSSGSFSGLIGLVIGGVNGNAAFNSAGHNPPFLVVNYIIKY